MPDRVLKHLSHGTYANVFLCMFGIVVYIHSCHCKSNTIFTMEKLLSKEKKRAEAKVVGSSLTSLLLREVA